MGVHFGNIWCPICPVLRDIAAAVDRMSSVVPLMQLLQLASLAGDRNACFVEPFCGKELQDQYTRPLVIEHAYLKYTTWFGEWPTSVLHDEWQCMVYSSSATVPMVPLEKFVATSQGNITLLTFVDERILLNSSEIQLMRSSFLKPNSSIIQCGYLDSMSIV